MQTFIELYQEQDRICAECFDNNVNFKFILNKAFEDGLNRETSVGLVHRAVFASLYARTRHK